MKPISTKMYPAWKFLAIWLLTLGILSAPGTVARSAPGLMPRRSTDFPIDPARQHMLDIAYLYANHRWMAAATNLIHPDGIHDDNDADAYKCTDPDPTLGLSTSHFWHQGKVENLRRLVQQIDGAAGLARRRADEWHCILRATLQ